MAFDSEQNPVTNMLEPKHPPNTYINEANATPSFVFHRYFSQHLFRSTQSEAPAISDLKAFIHYMFVLDLLESPSFHQYTSPQAKMPMGFPAFRHDPTAPVNPVFLKKSRGSAAASPPPYRDSPSERSLPRYTDKAEPKDNKEKDSGNLKGMYCVSDW